MSPDDPRHGSYAGAVAHWRAGVPVCDACRTAATRKRKTNELAALAGRPNTVELGEVAWTVIASTPRNQLVVASGMTHDRLARYHQAGPSKRVHRRTRDRILAARIPEWTPVGVQRRLRALAALGWSLRALEERSGIHATSMGKLRARPVVRHVRYEFADRVVALYDEIHMQVPTPGASATETRNHALAAGWVPPLAWDDIDRDETPMTPDAWSWRDSVDPVVVERVLAGHRLRTTTAEKREVVHRWFEGGGSWSELERRTGWAIERYIERDQESNDDDLAVSA